MEARVCEFACELHTELEACTHVRAAAAGRRMHEALGMFDWAQCSGISMRTLRLRQWSTFVAVGYVCCADNESVASPCEERARRALLLHAGAHACETRRSPRRLLRAHGRMHSVVVSEGARK